MVIIAGFGCFPSSFYFLLSAYFVPTFSKNTNITTFSKNAEEDYINQYNISRITKIKAFSPKQLFTTGDVLVQIICSYLMDGKHGCFSKYKIQFKHNSTGKNPDKLQCLLFVCQY